MGDAIKDVESMLASARRSLMPRSVVTTLEQRLSALRTKKRQARRIGARYYSAVAKVRRLRAAKEGAAEEISRTQKAMHEASAKHAGYSAAENEAQQELDKVACEKEGAKRGSECDDDAKVVMHRVDGIETVIAQNPQAQLPENLRKMVRRSRDHPACCPRPAKQGRQTGDRPDADPGR